MRFVIIGAGIAGVNAARTIREIDNDTDIVLIGKEIHFPYNRFLLTEYLCDAIGDNMLYYSSAEFFSELNIRFRKGEHVKSIDPSNRTIKLFHNEVMRYDKVLISIGGCSAVGPVLRPYEKYIQRYNTLENVLELKKKLPHTQQCVVSGDSLTTLDLMCGLCNLQKQITYIVPGKKATFPRIESEFGDEVHGFLLDKGIQIITEDRIEKIQKTDRTYTVSTMHGKDIRCDLVFASDDYRPDLCLIENTTMERKKGILVDQRLRTSADDIYAAGDCVEIYHPGMKDYWTNFGWPNAAKQGIIAGKNMAGADEEYEISEVLSFSLMGKSLKARWWG